MVLVSRRAGVASASETGHRQGPHNGVEISNLPLAASHSILRARAVHMHTLLLCTYLLLLILYIFACTVYVWISCSGNSRRKPKRTFSMQLIIVNT